jgi:dephospho-CoA kinase
VVDADQLAKQTYCDSAVIEQIVQWWGKAVVKPDGEIDRRKIAGIVFGNEEQKRRLEGLIHPKVFEARRALHVQFQADEAVVAIVEDCPLLLEVGLDKACDVLVLVDTPRDQRLARVRATRGWDEEELARREKNQMGLDKKADRADYVLKNDAGEAECFAHVRRVLSQILHQ